MQRHHDALYGGGIGDRGRSFRSRIGASANLARSSLPHSEPRPFVAAPSMPERPVALSPNYGYATMILRIADDFQSIAASLKKLERDKEAATVADVPLYSADLPISHRRSCG